MPRECVITGRRRAFGNNVSHAKNHTRRSFNPNLQYSRLYSYVMKRHFRMRISTQGMRTLDKMGGFDAWLLKTPARDMNSELKKLKGQVTAASAAATQA